MNFWKTLILVFVLASGLSSFATHNRAGEITYRHLNGFTYEVTITTCTKTSVIADRQWLNVDWGDTPQGALLDSLERVSILDFNGLDAQQNSYVGTHTYPGPGIYSISMEDPNRNESVTNIGNSIDMPFCVISELIINPQAGHNNSVQLLNPPKEKACLNKLWIHNPGAFDPDGDILTYEIVPCLGAACEEIITWQNPGSPEWTGCNGSFTIDVNTGDLVWDCCSYAGEYNVAILITEWRNVDGQLLKVGSVMRDMQITVEICDNNPPIIEDIPDYCVVIDDLVQINMAVADPDGDGISLSAVGGPFQVDNFATFNQVIGLFQWQPDCPEVRQEPYYVHFKAQDNDATPLTDIETVAITVVAPPVQNPVVEPDGNAMQLNWEPHYCVSQFDSFEFNQFSYKIYRRNGSSGWQPDYCQRGVPEDIGYQHIATVEGLSSSAYLDEFGLGYGGEYCYLITARWPDGSESMASVEFCAELRKDVPVLTHVSVTDTDPDVGINEVIWSPPSQLDSANFGPPYFYRLYTSPGFNTAEDLIWESPESGFVISPDTTFTHSALDTETTPNTYRVAFYSEGELLSQSTPASSVWISLTPNDNQLTVNIEHSVPWVNTSYDIFLFDDVDGWVLNGTADSIAYDITGLTNNVEYCVYVEATGTYNSDAIVDPLINLSQEVCGIPYDLTPPCPPELNVNNDCENIVDSLDWTNPNLTCADDVVGYNLYYTPLEDGEYELIEFFDPEDFTDFVYNDDGEFNSIAGCFYVTALDSLLIGPDGELTQNESEPSNIVCVDNCPIYFLPNVFSPNNDLQNDLFIPFPWKFVESVDFQVFNRWGEQVFTITDPDLNWDGTHMTTGQILSDGVYYYTIKVNTIRLEGIVPENFSGQIQLFGSPSSENK